MKINALPAWDNSTEYTAIFSADFNQDFERAKNILIEVENMNIDLARLSGLQAVSVLQKISENSQIAFVLIRNLMTYCSCEKSLDATNTVAKKALAQLDQLWATFSMATTPSKMFLMTCEEQVLQSYLNSDKTRSETFLLSYERLQKDFLLSAEEEKTIAQFAPYALNGWGDLYGEIAGNLKVDLKSAGSVGMAQAAGLLRDPDQNVRKEAWQGIQAAWKQVEVPCASVLNSLSGYRLELYKKRSQTRSMTYMESPLHDSRIEKATLDAMMEAIQEKISVPRRALTAMAKALGKSKLDPWDLLAPSPQTASDFSYPFSEALEMITSAFATVHPSMGEFVTMMAKNNWIEARVLPNKAPGAHCTTFLKSNSPRVYQSYLGSLKDVSTLAHELGHAYHGWILRDIPFYKRHYPMTLAETASIFSETILSEILIERADAAGKFDLAWAEASDALSMLINIPARFDFEKSLFDRRANGPLSAQEMSECTDQAWKNWYGTELSENEKQFWMTKMHFSFSRISFYNYPYTFGYLFSLGIYALREKLGKKFHSTYVDILRDTGSMTAEELVQKHLGQDIRQKDFWMNSLSIVEKKVRYFESLVGIKA